MHLLQRQGEGDRLLQLLLGMKKRCAPRLVRWALPCCCVAAPQLSFAATKLHASETAKHAMQPSLLLHVRQPLPPRYPRRPAPLARRRLKSCAGADPRQARFLRRQALVLSESLLGTLDAGLDALDLASELEGAPMPSAQQQQHQHQHQHQQQQQQQQQRQWQAGDADGAAADQPPPPPQQQPQQAAEASAAEPMEVEGAAGQQQEGQQQGSPPAAGAPPAVAAAGEQPSPAAPAAATQATATPAAPAGGQGRHATTPGTDLRAALGTPLAALLSAEQQQLQERGLALLQVAWGFHKEVSRWLQVGLGGRTVCCGRVCKVLAGAADFFA